MPRHRTVPTLQNMCLEAVGSLIAVLVPSVLETINIYSNPQGCLQKSLDWLKQLLISHVPRYLYNLVAVHVLNSVKDQIEKVKKGYFPHTSITTFLTEMNVVVGLTEVMLTPYLKHVNFSIWPKIMRYVLYKNLRCLSGLEVLNLGSCTGGWKTKEYDKYILDGITQMKNLRSLCLCFDCTDYIMQIISENCPNLQILDVTSSRSVTDRSIDHILKLKQLHELQLHRTSVSMVGFAELIVGLEKLQDLGRCDDFGKVVKYIYENYYKIGPFNLKKFQIRDLTTDHLKLMVDMFPNIECLSLFHDEQNSDLTLLTTLCNLKDLKLLSCNFYTDYLKHVLEIRGCNLTSLHFEHVEEINLNALVYISQFCPHLKSLVLYNCDFVDQPESYSGWLKIKPFENLERVFWVVDCAINHLEFLLSHSINIRYIHLGSSTGITHSSVERILAVNPMKKLEELRVLYSIDMCIKTVEMILESCPNLRVLSELESWQEVSHEELLDFKCYISSHNFDLDIRPTLSYY